MLIKGSARGGAVDLARHLKSGDNERVTVIGVHGLAARDIEGALIEMDALGAGLKTPRTLYHMSISPEPGKDREMSEADWKFAERAALKKMGLDKQPYIFIEHQKIGKDGELRRHRHLVASRADLEHGRAIRADHNYRKHEELARALERHLGHERVQGAHAERDGKPRPERTPSYAEMQQDKRTGISRDEAKAFITGLWQTTDAARATKAALESHGWILARGDKTTAQGRAYLMVIDPQGGVHELARRVEGVKAAAIHARMAGIDPASLPSVAEAKAQRDRQHAQETAQEARQRQQPEAVRETRAGAGAGAAPQAPENRPDRQAEKHPEEGIPTYRPPSENASAATATGPIVAPEPETAGTGEKRTLGTTAGEIHAAWTAEAITRTEEHAADRHVREVVGKIERGVVQPIALGGKVLEKGLGIVARGLAAVLKIRPLAIFTAFDFGAGKPDSKEQTHQKAQAAGNVETLHARDYAATVQANEAARDEQMFRADQETQMPLAAPSYFRAITRPGNPADRERDDDRGREIERER
jgi:hypothetical protein